MALEGLLEQRFQKILVARYSPQNHCFAPDGSVLYPPPETLPGKSRPKVKYHFLSFSHPSSTSRFGWVKATDNQFSLRDFITEHWHADVQPEQCEVISKLFNAIAHLPDNTAVAGSYFLRGVENRRAELTFHKIFFYGDAGQGAEH